VDPYHRGGRGSNEEGLGMRWTLLVAGIALGILFNPVTGPETRRWLKEMISGSDDGFGGDYPPAAANGGT
ncbi:MAG TPA: YtxH domain-containing protein, partial [Candidatus Limnocylindrales bacterium]